MEVMEQDQLGKGPDCVVVEVETLSGKGQQEADSNSNVPVVEFGLHGKRNRQEEEQASSLGCSYLVDPFAEADQKVHRRIRSSPRHSTSTLSQWRAQ